MAKTIDTNRQEEFLRQYMRMCHIAQAAEAAGIERGMHYYWLKHDPTYRPRFEEADKIAIEALEDEASRRAMQGVDEPVFQGGEQVGTVRKYSDRLMEFLLRGRNPAKYGDRFRAEMSGPNGDPIKAEVKHEIVLVEGKSE